MAIQDNNRLYNLLSPMVQFACRCHYRSFVVRGKENLPTDGAYIFAPCHQQALMEPLAVLNVAPKPPVFLARADIFKKPALRRVLTFLKIMPVYRIRDGKETLGQNQEVFDLCRDVLLDGYPLCLMAEGRHNNRHHLLPFGKGMFRIAGETQQRLADHPLYIVPTGIDFDDYERPYSCCVVNIGKPIAVQPFMDCYRANEPVALNRMRDALAEALMPLMHDIRSDEHYDAILTLCHVLNKAMRRRKGLRNNAWNRFRMRQLIAQSVEGAARETEGGPYEKMILLGEKLRGQCCRLHLDPKTVGEHWSLAATLLVPAALLAVAAAVVAWRPLRMVTLFCLVCYPIPWLPTHSVVRRKVADPQFRSSFNFGVRFALSIVYALAVGIVMAATGGMWMAGMAGIGAWWGLVAMAAVFAGAWLSGPIAGSLMDAGSNCRYWWLRLTRRRAMKEVESTVASINEVFPAAGNPLPEKP